MTRCYHGVSDVAQLLAVTPSAVRRWRDIFDEGPRACPAPDVRIGSVCGWSDAGLVEWGAWYRRHKEERMSSKVRWQGGVGSRVR